MSTKNISPKCAATSAAAGIIIGGGAAALIKFAIAAKTVGVIPPTCAICLVNSGVISDTDQNAPHEKARNPSVAIENRGPTRAYQFGLAVARVTSNTTIDPTIVQIFSTVNPLPKVSSRKFDSTGFGLATSMHRHARLNPAHRLPHDHGIHAGNVLVGRFFKHLVRQAHGLIKKLLMVHSWIVGLLDSAEHSCFPMGFDNSIVRNAAFRRIPFILSTAE